MNFNKNLLAVLISSSLVVSAAHAAMSSPTPKVVGHKPVLAYNGTLPGAIKLGDTITVAEGDFAFTDVDGDTEAPRSYVWKLDGVATAVTSLQYDILLGATGDVKKRLTLVITPETTNGDPTLGDELVVDFGTIGVDATATPIISALAMVGTLQLNQNLSATYVFNPNGGDLNDKSTYQWGRVGDNTQTTVAGGTSVATSQVVDDYTLTNADIGEVIELSVQAKNGAGTTGNIETVTSAGLTGGGTGGEVVDPLNVDVKIIHGASGSEALNGPSFAGRPVVGKDLMTAKCKAVGAPEADFTTCNTGIYDLQWKSTPDAVTFSDIAGQTGNTYIPHTDHQGLQIVVDATVK
ncbi:hypothetical protein AB2J22_21330 [Aeromonas sp. A5]|uniref:hypothetical protein n=1 Tax=unclassified Aeromonas TaxID=257493 RepID=UPI00376F7A2D